MMFERTTLPNGLRILTCPMPHTRSVTLVFLIAGGSCYETDEQGGAFHFIEHLVFKGTRQHPTAQEISETIEGIGGVMNASTDREITSYWCKVPLPHLATGAELLADMVRHPLFNPEEMEKERGVILEELAMTKDYPDDRVGILLDEVLWPNQPLGRDVGGTPQSVQGLSRESLLSHMADQYVPSNTVVTVAGDVPHRQAVDLLTRYLGDWAPGEPRPWFPAQDGQVAPQVGLEWRRSEQGHLAIGVRGLPAAHPQRYALDLLSIMLGEGMSSRLFLELRERLGLVYTVHSGVGHFRDTGVLTVYAAAEPRKAAQALRSILAELQKLKREAPEAELTKAKEMAKGRLLLRLEDTRNVAFWIGTQELLLDRVLSVDEVVGRLEAVTVEEVQKLAQTLMVPQGLNLAVVGPYRSATRFEQLLGAWES